jgi:hypothetical protein
MVGPILDIAHPRAFAARRDHFVMWVQAFASPDDVPDFYGVAIEW